MRTPLVFILLAACALSACTNGGSKNSNVANSNGTANVVNPGETKPPVPTQPVDPNFKACNPYFPLVPGSRRIYTMSSASGLLSTATAQVDNRAHDGRKGLHAQIRMVDRTGGHHI